ncbi:type II toxin-antitoxin system PemK/MazF family toxin [Lamprobacter modestohalophilus]|uniref:type II toxin-antitoxin system PemK/MazF family toxin n=1 Tax=Lamprobacter modestohalophilus TaxID=1064514 RepID=UPI0019042CC9|nr:type II toxin-antitoxin system PemK/MazF family toxin [Lamprobacter modestohalophilus]
MTNRISVAPKDPFEVRLEGSAATGVALADQVKSLDWKSRQAERKGAASAVELADIRAKMITLLRLG